MAEVKSNHNGVACELCNKWYHAKCVGITAETYKFLKSCCVEASTDNGALGNGGVMWFCQDCMGTDFFQLFRKDKMIWKRN